MPVYPSHLLCFDLDGTLIDPWTRQPPPVELRMYVDLLEEAGAATVIATGRTLAQALLALRTFKIDLKPRFVIARDYQVHIATGPETWSCLEPWGFLAEAAHRAERAAYGDLLDQLRSFALGRPGVTFHEIDGGFGDFLCGNYADVLRICERIEQIRDQAPRLQYYCNNLHIRLGLTTFNKGTALAALSSHLGIAPRDVFAVGDNHNDLPMLSGGPARRVACPGNAVPMVKHAVRQSRGFVATAPAAQGLVEALYHLFLRG